MLIGDQMDNEEIKTVGIPLFFGIVSIILLGVYLLDVYYLDTSLRLVIMVIPVTSIIGLIVSFIVRRFINKHKGIWIAGFLCCLLCFLGFFIIVGLSLYNMGLALG